MNFTCNYSNISKAALKFLIRARILKQVFEKNMAINLDPEKFMYLFIHLCIGHLVYAVQDVVVMQK